ARVVPRRHRGARPLRIARADEDVTLGVRQPLRKPASLLTAASEDRDRLVHQQCAPAWCPRNTAHGERGEPLAPALVLRLAQDERGGRLRYHSWSWTRRSCSSAAWQDSLASRSAR